MDEKSNLKWSNKLQEIRRLKEEQLEAEELEEENRIRKEQEEYALFLERERLQDEYEEMLFKQNRLEELKFERLQRKIQNNHYTNNNDYYDDF